VTPLPACLHGLQSSLFGLKLRRLLLGAAALVTHSVFSLPVTAHNSSETVPEISYHLSTQNQRQLIFMNNPEFLWFNRKTCDLADSFPERRNLPCGRSLFHVDQLSQGSYRAWWEHRNMMPFGIHSGVLISNPTSFPVRLILNNEGIETNSFKNGGAEFVRMFNSPNKDIEITMAAGERRFLGSSQNKKIAPGHFFAGVIDFKVLEGEIKLEEVVYQSEPAAQLTPIGYSDRTDFGVHESLVYKGISQNSSVTLSGAHFIIDDTTPEGSLPVAYKFHEVLPFDGLQATCRPDRLPACVGNALRPFAQSVQSDSWVTHISPDPQDPNPKRKRAIVSDLIELALPGSAPSCASQWPIKVNSCMRMSHQFFWYLQDFKTWRLPNWGNWGVHYSHPIRISNKGAHPRLVKLRVTADGTSPIAFKGTGTGKHWQQVFLNPKSKSPEDASIVIAQATVDPQTDVDLFGEFILSGPGAGTLEHSIENSKLDE